MAMRESGEATALYRLLCAAEHRIFMAFAAPVEASVDATWP
jgi:hypothetical protein